VELLVRVGARLSAGEPLCILHTQTTGELDYALDYARRAQDIFQIKRG
jgi:thymidine phosphorylase